MIPERITKVDPSNAPEGFTKKNNPYSKNARLINKTVLVRLFRVKSFKSNFKNGANVPKRFKKFKS